MQLWIVRHAIAEDLSAAIASDFERPLSDKGRRRFRRLAEFLVEQGEQPDALLTSPLVRAVQTAELLCDAARLPRQELIVEPRLGPGLDVSVVLELLRSREPAAVTALVAHEPDCSRSLALLVGGGQFDFGKGNIACVEFTDELVLGRGNLRWFLRPGLVDE